VQKGHKARGLPRVTHLDMAHQAHISAISAISDCGGAVAEPPQSAILNLTQVTLPNYIFPIGLPP